MVERSRVPEGPLGDPLPKALDDEVVRQPLIDALAERWNRSLVLVEAPGGWGKSTAIAQAIRDNASDPTGLDVYVACGFDDADAPALAATIRDALGVAAPLPRDVDGMAGAVASAMAGRSPVEVCLVLDDVHRIADDDSSAELLRALVPRLPRNGHLVVAGRALPRLPISRLVAGDDATTLDTADLAFADAELHDLALAHDMTVDDLAGLGAWPALVRLTLTVGRAASVDFLMEEVVAELDDDVRTALVTAVLGRRVDDDALATLSATDVRAKQLADALPLIRTHDDGSIEPHDLWRPVVDRILAPDRRRDAARRVASWHRRHHRIDDALAVALGVDDIDLALHTLGAGVGHGDGNLSEARCRRWRDRFPAGLDRPELDVLELVRRRLAHGVVPEDADLLAEATERFRERGDQWWEAIALGEASARAWLSGDFRALYRVSRRADELADESEVGLDNFRRVVRASVADLAGRYAEAIDELAGIDIASCAPSLAVPVGTFRVGLYARTGESDLAVAAAQDLIDVVGHGLEQDLVAVAASWHDGDPRPMLARRGELGDQGNVRLDLHVAVHAAIMAACIGESVPGGIAGRFLLARTRDHAMAAIGDASVALTAGDEDEAARIVDALLAEHDDAMARGELRRFPSVPYLVSQAARDVLDAEDSGPSLDRRRAQCRAVLAARRGAPVDWSQVPDSATVLCDLPLHHAVELAARGHAAAPGRAAELCRTLFDAAPGPTRRRLVALQRADVAGADELLAVLPHASAVPTSVRVCGRTRVGFDGRETSIGRVRVRQLLTLLCLDRVVRRDDLCAALWPDADPPAARNNLRVNLTHLRSTLEPEREPGTPSSHLGEQDDTLWLYRSETLTCDAWAIRRHLDQARDAQRSGDDDGATRHVVAAAEAWTGPVFADLHDLGGLAHDRAVAFEREVFERVAETAEQALATGDADLARRLGERLREADPLDERPLRLLVAIALADGDHATAVAEAHRLRSLLAELGVEASTATAMVLRRLDTRVA